MLHVIDADDASFTQTTRCDVEILRQIFLRMISIDMEETDGGSAYVPIESRVIEVEGVTYDDGDSIVGDAIGSEIVGEIRLQSIDAKLVDADSAFTFSKGERKRNEKTAFVYTDFGHMSVNAHAGLIEDQSKNDPSREQRGHARNGSVSLAEVIGDFVIHNDRSPLKEWH
jgi:hypothetical protein